MVGARTGLVCLLQHFHCQLWTLEWGGGDGEGVKEGLNEAPGVAVDD